MSDSRRKPAALKIASFATPSLAPINTKLDTKSPRTPRFAEATAVYSPLTPRTTHVQAQPQIADVGFGYMGKHESVEMPGDDASEEYKMPKSPLKSPLKSAMKTPGAAPRFFGDEMLSPTFKEEMIKSPTWKEEEILDKKDMQTDRQQASDLKVKVRVRIAKFFLRGVNFSCSLIVLSMLTYSFQIFNATKSLPPRNNLPPWAQNQQTWPQILLLSLSCVSLFCCLLVFWGYWKGGHAKAQKKGAYYSAFAVVFFVFSIVMWLTGAIVLQQSKANGNGKDFWGWSCLDNARSQLFQNEVKYDLICRLQNWSLVCAIIEVVVEVFTIAVYAIVFYRFYSKRQLRKSMAIRDRARSDLYLAQLKSQSVPNTPGGPLSPRDGGYRPPNMTAYYGMPDAEEGIQYVDPDHKAQPAAFHLQAAPVKNGTTPKMQQLGFTPIQDPASMHRPLQPPPSSPTPVQPVSQLPQMPLSPSTPREQRQEHFGAAPGEQVYAAVPIPGAYMPVSPTNTQFGNKDFR